LNTRKYEINPTLVDPDAKWTRVNIPLIWSSELFPLLERRKRLQRSLEQAVNEWADAGWCFPDQLKKPWRYDDPEARSPFFLSKCDAAVTWVDDRIDKEAQAGDPLALEYGAVFEKGFGSEIEEDDQKRLLEKSSQLWRHFEPDRAKTPLALRPYGSCHYFCLFQYRLANAWKPSCNWRILRGDDHSTVIEPERLLVFDWLLLDAADDEPVLFSLSDSRSSSLMERKRLEEHVSDMALLKELKEVNAILAELDQD
jgi:hypothetical protein